MRLHSDQQLLTHDGSVTICDAAWMPPRASDVARLFDVSQGEYAVYRVADAGCVVLDLAPRSVRAGARKELERVGTVIVVTGSIAVFDPWNGPAGAVGVVGCTTRFAENRLRVWLEKKDSAAIRGGAVLGVGPNVHLLLSGPDADHVLDLERRVAAAIRAKGPDREPLLQELRQEVLDLYVGGSKDGRLGVLAQALKLKLPRRSRKP